MFVRNQDGMVDNLNNIERIMTKNKVVTVYCSDKRRFDYQFETDKEASEFVSVITGDNVWNIGSPADK